MFHVQVSSLDAFSNHRFLYLPSCATDKPERMLGIINYFIKGDEHALDGFPGGSEPGSR
jgi:hypothetical protein